LRPRFGAHLDLGFSEAGKDVQAGFRRGQFALDGLRQFGIHPKMLAA
jgi:hypothetical protein